MKNPKNIKKGCKIRILRMSGEKNYDGKIGVVEHIDDAGQLHGSWGGLAVIPNEDEFEIIKKEMKMDKYCLTIVNENNKLLWKKKELKANEELKCLQEEVGGKIESISYLFPELNEKNILTYINQNSKANRMPTTLIYLDKRKNYEEIKGNICFTKVNKKGELIGLNSKDIALIYGSIGGL